MRAAGMPKQASLHSAGSRIALDDWEVKMSMDRDRTIERIRKLMSVTEKRGATEAEAIAAALAAQRLIADNDVEQWELFEETEEITSIEIRKSRAWMINLATVIAENFRCKCYHLSKSEGGCRRRSYVGFMGYKSDVEAASLVYEKLSEIGNKRANAWSKERVRMLEFQGYSVKRQLIHNKFTEAFVEGVRSELEKQSRALMIVCPKEVGAAYDEFVSGCKPYRTRLKSYRNDSESAAEGFRVGRDAIRSGRLPESRESMLLASS